ncbi:Protein AF-9 [Desmophyllum pertusum]|uniref:Protein AF-9 n=1 Tax=Desmophyllum pertusum TaxID=174260 RepID=A0A9W9ZN29_9CNID|nr:Protein AF-9 [Desmophyllum pertusum]
MESVQVDVKIELGHTASVKKNPSPEGFTHDWVVFVRGPENCDISNFVEKVVFYLHESFTKPKRDPPYRVEEQGYGSFFLPVEVYFKNKEEPRKLKFDYDLVLPALGSLPIDNIRSEALTFTNPTEEFRKKLVKGGGIASIGTVNGIHR